jgi:hypothetical protein
VFTELKIAAGRRPMTDGEARTSAIVGTIITILFLAAVFEEYTPQKLSIIFFVVLWVPMLILHELGHAIVARMVGWRVKEIVIGFGRTLWKWKIGETILKIKLAPIEGYVLPAPVDTSNVRLKSMAIYAAGPGIELLLLVLLLILFGWDTVFNNSDAVSLIALKTLAVVILVGAGFNLLPFKTEGAVSDGLGILSSPFMTNEAIEMRLLTFDMREVQKMLDHDRADLAVEKVRALQERFPHNQWLALTYVGTLAAADQTEAARELARDNLAEKDMPDGVQREWFKIQAAIELGSDEPDYLTLDLALQKASKLTPNAPDLLAIKGASFVMRGRNEDGGNMLELAWRKNDGSASDPMMLAYLTIAAHRVGDREACDHFRNAFEQTNRSATLSKRVERMA